MKRRAEGGNKNKKRCTDTFQNVTIRTLDGARALLRDGIASKLTGDPKDVLIFIRLGDKDDRFLICKKFELKWIRHQYPQKLPKMHG